MITGIVLEVKNKGECFITGSRRRETDEAIGWLLASVSRRLEPVMKHKAGVVPTILCKPPVQIQVPSTACDVISYNGEGQLRLLSCTEWRDLSNHTKVSTNQPRRPEKKVKNHVTLTRKFPWKSCFTTHLLFFSSNPKILKAFPKTFPTKMKPTKCPARGKKSGKKNERRGEKKKRKEKVKTAVRLLNPKPQNFAQTLQADILQVDQKAAKCTTCKQLCGKF